MILRVLHVFSDWKWTGPSEPVVRLCRALRDIGVEIELQCEATPDGRDDGVRERAADLEPRAELRMARSPHILAMLKDVKTLARGIDERDIDVAHVHNSHDHIIGSRAARKSDRKPAVVRTNHKAIPMKSGFFSRRLVNGFTDGIIELSCAAMEADLRTYGMSEDKILRIEGSVDLERFHPAAAGREIRSELGLEPDDIVVGMVARIQPHRRFDVFLEAIKSAAEQCDRLRAMIVGRGTHAEELTVRPAERMGITDRVVFPGYRKDDYVQVLGAMDFLVFLVPGSDGSCRAAREAMAMGKPVVAANRGMLPELVDNEECGLVVDDAPEKLAEAIVRMASDEALRRRLGEGAARKAAERFRIDEQAKAVAGFYERLIAARG